MAICTKVASTFFVTVLYVAVVSGQNQNVVLFDQFNETGSSIFISDTYKSDLKNESFDDRAKSACASGVWLFYEDPNYNPTGGRKVEYIFGKNNYCVNFKVVFDSVSSVRYAGHPQDPTIDTFTIYQYSFFQGKEEYAFNQLDSLESLSGDHQSIIITGNCDWTIFDQPNFQGNSICLKVPKIESGDTIPAFIADLKDHTDGPIPHGSIKSARKGCEDGANIKLSSFGLFGSL